MIDFAVVPSPAPTTAPTFADLLDWRARFAAGASVRAIASMTGASEHDIAWACAGICRADGIAVAPPRVIRIPIRPGHTFGRSVTAPKRNSVRARLRRIGLAFAGDFA